MSVWVERGVRKGVLRGGGERVEGCREGSSGHGSCWLVVWGGGGGWRDKVL